MDLFIKKILAKYIVYIEIIGYGFVILFIAGLVALSFIKAEDEYVPLKGRYKVNTSLIRFDQKQIILESISGSTPFVHQGDLLAHVTDDRLFISDHIIKKTLEEQIKTAQEIQDINLVERLLSMLSEVKKRTYPDLKITLISSPISGDVFLLKGKDEIVEENEIMGGIFDFKTACIYISEFPVDNQQKRKLKIGQSGTATVHLHNGKTFSFAVKMVMCSADEMVFQLENISFENKQRIARFVFQGGNITILNVSVSVHVGSRSWMNLIWQ